MQPSVIPQFAPLQARGRSLVVETGAAQIEARHLEIKTSPVLTVDSKKSHGQRYTAHINYLVLDQEESPNQMELASPCLIPVPPHNTPRVGHDDAGDGATFELSDDVAEDPLMLASSGPGAQGIPDVNGSLNEPGATEPSNACASARVQSASLWAMEPDSDEERPPWTPIAPKTFGTWPHVCTRVYA